MSKKCSTPLVCEICILTGGLSRRMGRDKARLRLGNRTMLDHIRTAAKATGLPVRTISRDLVPRCGPLGGIFTALKTTHADAVLFLACDMPFVSTGLLEFLSKKFASQGGASVPASRGHATPSGSRGRSPHQLHALFTQTHHQAGFPFIIPQNRLSTIEKQIAQKEFSLQKLASALHAKRPKLPPRFADQLQNINTPADLTQARQNEKPQRHRAHRD